MRKLEKILIATFILIQIVLDMLRNTNFVNIEILNISILELINITLVLTIFIIALIKNKKNIKKYILYFLILGIYFILHHYNTTLFNQSAYSNQNPNFFIETYHIFINFVIPILTMFSICESHIKKKDLITIIKYFAFISSFLIVILNIFKFSYQSYDNGEFIKYNLFDWLTYNGNNYYELTSKGLFNSGNQMSAILLMCLPITLLSLYKEKSLKHYIFLSFNILAMYMLGTKVASIGVMLVFLYFFFVYIFCHLTNKKKLKPLNNIIVYSIIACSIFLISPLAISYRMTEVVYYEDNSKNEDYQKMYSLNCNSNLNQEKEFILNYIETYRDNLNIPDYILESYPVSDDLNYWCTFLNNKNLPINDYRVMKTNILNKIYKNNNNQYDKLLGMGNTLNFIYTEKDYIYQFYLYGIIGLIILIGPFYLVIIKNGIKILSNLKKLATIDNLMIIISPLLGLLIAYLSGHILERAFPLFIVAVLCSLSYKSINEKIKMTV